MLFMREVSLPKVTPRGHHSTPHLPFVFYFPETQRGSLTPSTAVELSDEEE